jgi:basic amino acid/polyamine antiporter, APA family
MAEFKRVLGLPTAILLVAGTMIGSGAFKKIVPMAQALHNESYILLAWIIAGVISLFGAITYAGLSRMTSETGGVYEYLRLIYGDFVSFLFGWSLFMIVGSGAIAALAVVFAQSVAALFPISSLAIKALAAATIVVLTWVNYRGVKKAGVLNNIVTTAKIAGILLLVVTGILYAGHPAGYAADSAVQIPGTALAHLPATAGVPPPWAAMVHSPATSITGAALFSALLGAMLSALWAYDGWANITFVAGEIKDPQRNVPYAIIGGVGIAMTLYVLLNFAYMRVLSLDRLASLGPDRIAAAEVAGALMGRTGTVIIAALIMTCTFGALNGCITTYSRVYFRMAQEKAFFASAAKIHPGFLTPVVALLYSGLWSIVLVCSGTFDQITNLIVFASYAFFAFAAWGLILMRRKGVIRSKVFGYPVIPILIILFCVALVVNTFITQTRDSLLGLALIGSGLPFYLYFRRRPRPKTTTVE